MKLTYALALATLLTFAAPAPAQELAGAGRALGPAQPIGAQEPAVPQVQDLWWGGPQESGWSLSIVQHGERLFAVLYVYEDTAHTAWYVIPGGTWNEARTSFTGAAYSPHATYYPQYDPHAFVMGDPVGQVRLEFESGDRATLDYTLRGFHGRRPIERQPFGAPAASSPQAGVTDIWWGGPEQNGWGVAIMQQGATLYSFFFSYERFGNPAWWLSPGGRWLDERTYEGRVYRPVGSRWLDVPFDSTKIWAADAGPFRLTFEDREHVLLEFTILGTGARYPLTRLQF